MRHLPRAQCVRTRAPAPPLAQDTGCGGRSGATVTAARMIAVSECLRAVRRAGQQTADGRPEAGQRTTRGADGATTAGRRKAASEHGAARPQNGGAPRGRRAARRGTARTRREYGGPGRAQATWGPAAPERGSSGRRPRGPGAGAVGGRRDGTRAQRGAGPGRGRGGAARRRLPDGQVEAGSARPGGQARAGARAAARTRAARRRRRAETGGERRRGQLGSGAAGRVPGQHSGRTGKPRSTARPRGTDGTSSAAGWRLRAPSAGGSARPLEAADPQDGQAIPAAQHRG